MAPGRKFRTSRMSAALDALGNMGYARTRVRSMMNKLLRVYGGLDGYPFIEDNAYLVLIEALLEEDEEIKRREASIQGDSSVGQRVGDVTARPYNGNVGYSNSHPVETQMQSELAEGDGCQEDRTISRAVRATDDPAGEGNFRDSSRLDLLAACASSLQSPPISTRRQRPCEAQLRRSTRKLRSG